VTHRAIQELLGYQGSDSTTVNPHPWLTWTLAQKSPADFGVAQNTNMAFSRPRKPGTGAAVLADPRGSRIRWGATKK